MPEIQLCKKLLPFLTKKKRYKVAFGGRGGGKSMTIANILLLKIQTEGLKAGCFREFQTSIEDSVHALLSKQIMTVQLSGFDVQQSKINCAGGGRVRYKGLARNITSVKSMDGFNIFWIEEGQTISAESLKILTPTLRTADSEVWFTANRMSDADPFSQRFIIPYESELLEHGVYEDDLHYIVKINYSDNPFFPDVLEQERRYDEEHLSEATYNHIWLGESDDTVEDAIIPVKWFNAAIDAHEKLGFKPIGAKVLAHDPSDEGKDSKAICYRHGVVVLDVQEMKDGDINDGCEWALSLAKKYNVDQFVWDVGGLAVALKLQVIRAFKDTKIDYILFNGSDGVERPDDNFDGDKLYGEENKDKTNKEMLLNKRAQYFARLRMRFFNTYCAVEKGAFIDPDSLISISSEIKCLAKLRSEVCRIPSVPNGSGKFQIMSKENMLRRHRIQSPNLADALMMSQIFIEAKGTSRPLRFKSEF